MTVKVNIPPTADAGDSISLTLPNNSLIIEGLAGDIDGTFTVVWTKEETDVPATIVSPNSPTTEIKELVKGLYVFKLTVTDNDGATAYDRMFVDVKDP